eukprot:CAMPEP_0170441698 /NCGR_PEP_ID=MMETSP0117_2-20130122/47031_1 /TAXON_ID=400756 /ORGANISM="Durinskia baltica, Strain CSIRO CS-38" /LENGTH=92 /DNA_ID=CAMNT_0010702253 /DNA_START=108 /DNA_END=385 /DNA_ORIENTATION=-
MTPLPTTADTSASPAANGPNNCAFGVVLQELINPCNSGNLHCLQQVEGLIRHQDGGGDLSVQHVPHESVPLAVIRSADLAVCVQSRMCSNVG